MKTGWKQIISDVLFFGALGFWLAFSVMRLNTTTDCAFWEWTHQSGLFRGVCIGCLVVLVVRELIDHRWGWRTLAGLVVFGALALISFPLGRTSLYVFGAAIFVFAGRDVPLKKVAWFCLVVISALFVLVMLSTLTDLNYDYVKMNARGQERHSVGFYHPNTFAAFAFTIMALWGYVRGKKFGLADAAAFVVSNVVVYAVSISRTGLVVGLFLTAGVFAGSRFEGRESRSVALQVLAAAAIPAVAAVGVALPYFYDPSIGWMSALNTALSGRLDLCHNALFGYGVTLFGQPIKFVPEIAYAVDIAYVRVLITLGAVFLAVALVLCSWRSCVCCRHGEWILLAIMVVTAIQGISETCCMYLEWNPFLFALGSLFALTPKREA